MRLQLRQLEASQPGCTTVCSAEYDSVYCSSSRVELVVEALAVGVGAVKLVGMLDFIDNR